MSRSSALRKVNNSKCMKCCIQLSGRPETSRPGLPSTARPGRTLLPYLIEILPAKIFFWEKKNPYTYQVTQGINRKSSFPTLSSRSPSPSKSCLFTSQVHTPSKTGFRRYMYYYMHLKWITCRLSLGYITVIAVQYIQRLRTFQEHAL